MTLQQKLHELFLLDQQVRGLRTRLDAATRRLKAQQTKLEQLQRQRKELGDQLRQVQAAAAGFELQVKAMDERVEKLRGQMNNVTNNKEYSAMLVEVNTLKLEKSKVEEQALEQMGKVDLVKQEVAEIEAKIAEQTKMAGGARAEVESARAEVGQRLDEATKSRSAAAASVPADALAAFERQANAHDGEAMAGVIEENRRLMEYTCGGCYMAIPAERVNCLFTRPEEIVGCPNCGRLLFLDEQFKESMKK